MDGSSLIRLRISETTRETDLFLAHDGRDKIPLAPGDEIEVRKAGSPVRLVSSRRITSSGI